jgi:hypothetical protein
MFEPANEFVINQLIGLNDEDELKLLKFLNLHYLGDEDCYELVDGVMVLKYPEKETPKFKAAKYRASSKLFVSLKLTYDVDGRCTVEVLDGL